MDKTYYIAEIMRGRRRRVFLFEIDKDDTLESIVHRAFGNETAIVKYRFPTLEERILMGRSMVSSNDYK
ncbi:MAG: hypothetical protein IJ682_12560 [Lachnospiraceae bacterium]|nr:hypothetical protein [Lachnospiraceae bacterium]